MEIEAAILGSRNRKDCKRVGQRGNRWSMEGLTRAGGEVDRRGAVAHQESSLLSQDGLDITGPQAPLRLPDKAELRGRLSLGSLFSRYWHMYLESNDGPNS